MTEDICLYKGPCDSCGSSDACAVYADGHTHCYSCGKHTNGEGGVEMVKEENTKTFTPLKGEVPEFGLTIRRIDTRSLEAYGVTVARDPRLGMVHVYPYYNKDKQLVAQHLRTKDKDFPWRGKPTEAVPFGSRVRSDTGKRLVLTEGELDALAAYQMFNYTWPVWSIACGAGPQVKKYISKHRELFRRFEEVVICFDSDAQGVRAAEEAAEIIGHDKVKIASLPLHDASDMLKAELAGEFKGCIYTAKRYTPDEIVTLDDLDFDKEPELGLDTGFESFDELCLGLRMGEIHVVGAGTAAGKTDFMLQMVKHWMSKGVNVGTFMLEQAPLETGIRLAGKFVGKPLHIPADQGDWTSAIRTSGITQLKESPGKLYLYDSFGINEWAVLQERMRFLVHQSNVKVFILDHITALAASLEDERRELDRILAEMGGLVKELDCAIIAVSHLARPSGKGSTPHEEGGRIQLRHMRGSHAIGMWAHYAWGLERDQLATDPLERRTTTVRCLKDRYTGRATGKTFRIRYDHATGLLKDLGVDSFDASPVVVDEKANPFEETDY